MVKIIQVSLILILFLGLLQYNLSYGVVPATFDFSFGSVGTGNGQFNAPEDTAVDSSGNIYVVDTGNNRIQKFNSAGTYVSQFGGVGTANGKFSAPSAIALDSSGNIFVADTNNNRIQKFNSAGVYQSKFGSAGTGNGRFNFPDDLTIDSSGNIYVVDTGNNRIQKFNSAGTYVSQFGGVGTANGKFSAPSAIALDSSGNIFVADTNNNRIQKFNSAGTYVSQFGSSGSGTGQFLVPQGVSIDGYGNILVSDTGNHRIQKFTSSGVFVTSFGSFGTGSQQFNYPQQITMKTLQGFVADTTNNRVWVFHFSDSPVADNQHVMTLEETPLSITLTASDANNDPLTYSIVSSTSHGSLTGTGSSRTYTPNTNYFGSDSFTFKANDGTHDSNIATIQIDIGNINDVPTTSSQSVTTNEDTSLPVTITASDADGDTLQYTMVTQAQYGSISGTLPNITYTPNLNYFGTDSFSFKTNDGLVDSNTSTITVTINSINDAPVAYNVNATVNEDTLLHTRNIPYQQTDVENDPVSFIIITPLTHGTLAGDPNDLIYTPDPNYYGSDCMTFRFNDGQYDSNVATACAIVLPVNDAPVASDQSVQTNEDVPIDITLDATDVENDALVYSIAVQPSHGILSGSMPDLTYTPDPNHYGTDDFMFRAYDGNDYSNTGTIHVTINAVNDPPISYSMNFTTPEDTPFTNADIVAFDAEGDPLTYALVTPQEHGTLTGIPPFMTYTPNANYVGPDSLTFKVNDGSSDSNISTLRMNIGPLNDQPNTYDQSIITDEDTPINITLTASDADGDPLTYSIVSSPINGVLSGTLPNLTYIPAQNDFGTDSLTFKVNDGLSDSNTSVVSITINPINDAPIFSDIYATMYEDTPLPFQNLDITGSDVENDALIHIPVSAFSHITYSGAYPNFSLIPAQNYFGSDEYVFKLNDGSLLSDAIHAYITILPVNDAPVADDQQVTLEQNTLQHIELTASDIENDTLTYEIISQPSHGVLFENHHAYYLPNRNYVGIDEFTFKANDGNSTSLPATVSITITPQAEEDTTQETTASDSGRFTVTSIPKISEFTLHDASQISGTDLTKSPKTLTIETGKKVTLHAVLDDEEASSNIIHLGMYVNTKNGVIDNSDAKVIYDMGSPLKVIDEQGLFSDAHFSTSYVGKSMVVDVDLTFAKPLEASDIVLEVWNQGRNPVYQTISSALQVTEPENTGPNISGSIMMPDTESKDPIGVFSIASGKSIKIKNNDVIVLPNKDLGVRISGFIDGVQRADKVTLVILRPDDTVYYTNSFLSEDGDYMILTKLHTKWLSGFYEISVIYNDQEEGKLQFFVTDKESTTGAYPAIMNNIEKTDLIYQYLTGKITKGDFTIYLKAAGWSQDRIDEFILKNRQAYFNPYTFYYLAGLVSLLFVLVSYLAKGKRKTPHTQQ